MNLLYEEVRTSPFTKKNFETLIGSDNPDLVSIMEFSDQDALNKVFKSKIY